MSQVHTRQMGRLTAAGVKGDLDDALAILARLKALHFIDYDGSEDGLSLGTPASKADDISRVLNKVRAAAAQVEASGPGDAVPAGPVREAISGDLPTKVDALLDDLSRIDEIEASLASQTEEETTLRMVSPLGIDVELLSGFESITSFVGTAKDVNAARAAAGDGIFASGSADGENVVGVFVRNEDAAATASALDAAGFTALQLPSGEGDSTTRLNDLANIRLGLQSEREGLDGAVESWTEENGEDLVCSLEILERDHELTTSPVRVAVSDHAFIIDGWVEMDRAHDIKIALGGACIVVDVEPFVIEAGGGHHDHDHHHEPVSPPIAFQPRKATKPLELVTDMVGRPGYGRLDPTLFMFITYPLFFGLMLGDMAYGLLTMGLGGLLMSKAGTNDGLKLGGRFLLLIGGATVLFGYIYAEFAGWEIFPHYGHHSPVEFMQALYPAVDSHGHVFEVALGYNITFAFPFHRVSSNLMDLIVLTLYMGWIHVMVGLIMGFRDVLFIGNGHGGIGWVAAFFEKGAWMVLLVGGLLFTHAYIGSHGEFMTAGVTLIGIATACLVWTLYRYHGLDLPIALMMGPIEALGMMPTIISYVRLFAVGVVGVKIAETGNHMFFDNISLDEPLMAIALFIGWFVVQAFAWVLGVFSPNIHAARLHMVEWMKQYYDSSGKPFSPFGGTSRYVEGE